MNEPRNFVAITCRTVPHGTPTPPDCMRLGLTVIKAVDLREALQLAYLRKAKALPGKEGLETGVKPAA